MIIDTVALVLVLLGAILCVLAGIGLLRLRDVPSRLHAATKPQVLGLLLILAACALSLRSWSALALLAAVAILQFATAPLSAHMVGRQAYRNGGALPLVVDEFADDQRRDEDVRRSDGG
ncbi:MAG: monovalent cation/H(+) antiporter subunit G [Microbacterium sp.]